LTIFHCLEKITGLKSYPSKSFQNYLSALCIVNPIPQHRTANAPAIDLAILVPVQNHRWMWRFCFFCQDFKFWSIRVYACL